MLRLPQIGRTDKQAHHAAASDHLRTQFGRTAKDEVALFDEFINYVREHGSTSMQCPTNGVISCRRITTFRMAWSTIRAMNSTLDDTSVSYLIDFIESNRSQLPQFPQPVLERIANVTIEVTAYMNSVRNHKLLREDVLNLLQTFADLCVHRQYGATIGRTDKQHEFWGRVSGQQHEKKGW